MIFNALLSISVYIEQNYVLRSGISSRMACVKKFCRSGNMHIYVSILAVLIKPQIFYRDNNDIILFSALY